MVPRVYGDEPYILLKNGTAIRQSRYPRMMAIAKNAKRAGLTVAEYMALPEFNDRNYEGGRRTRRMRRRSSTRRRKGTRKH